MSEPDKALSQEELIDSPTLRWFMVLMALALPAMGAFLPLWDADTFWHLSAGRFTLENGRVAQADWLSWTSQGTPWSNFEWLPQPLMYLVENTFGGFGLQVLAALLVLGAAGGLLLLAHRDGRTRSTALVLLILFPVLLERLRPRPEIFAWILVPAVLAIARWPRTPRLLAGVVIAWTWTQSHASWVLWPLFFGLGLALSQREFDWRKDLPGFFLPLVGLVSPVGPAILWNPFAHIFALSDMPIAIAEWAPLPLSGWGWLALAAVWVIAGLIWGEPLEHLQGSGWGKRILLAGSLAALLLLTVKWGRTAPFLALALASLAQRFPPGGQRAIPWLALLPFIFHFQALAPRMGVGYNQESWPVPLVSRLVKEKPRQPVFHAYRFGGLLGYAQGDQRLVFFDGRYFPFLEQLQDLSEAMSSAEKAQAFHDKYRVGWALLDYPGVVHRETGAPAWDLIFPPDQWLLLDFDDGGKLLIHRRVYDPLRHGPVYLGLDPDHPEALGRALETEQGRQRILQELARHRHEHPECQRREALIGRHGLSPDLPSAEDTP